MSPISHEAVANPGRVPPAIEYCIDSNNLVLNPLVDGEGETFGQKSVIPEVQSVNPGIKIE